MNVGASGAASPRQESPGAPRGSQAFGVALRRGLAATSRAGLESVGDEAPGRGAPLPGELGRRACDVGSGAERLPPMPSSAIHRVALAVEALRASDRHRVDIAFHPGATLQLSAASDGVRLVFAVTAPLARLASTELPAIVEALRGRGVKVARAEVRVVPGGGRGGGRAR